MSIYLQKRTIRAILLLLLTIAILKGQISTSLTFSEETDCDGQNLVEICYDFPCDSGFVNISASSDGGSSWIESGEGWFSSLTEAEGDLGIITESGEHCFTWNAGTDLPDYESDDFQILIETSCDGMICPRDRNKILIYSNENSDHEGREDFTELAAILEAEGYEVILDGRDFTEDITTLITDDIGQIWLLCTEYSGSATFDTGELSAIYDFVESCGNLAVFTDEEPTYTSDPNAIGEHYGIEFSGNYDHTLTGIPVECNDEILVHGHGTTEGISIISQARTQSEIKYTGDFGAFSPLILIHPRGTYSVYDTVHAVLSTGLSNLYFCSGYPFLLNPFFDGCDNIQLAENIASWLSEIPTLPGDTIVDISTGPLDTRPPVPVLDCPPGRFSPGESITLSWSISDDFPLYEDIILTIDAGSGGTPVIVDGDEYHYTIPSTDEDITVSISVRDSFCNWGTTECTIEVETPTVFTEITFSEETDCDGQNLVEICYDFPCDSGFVDISASSDGGSSWIEAGDGWFSTLTEAEGDIGAITERGEHCFIWNAGTDLPGYESDDFQIRIETDCGGMACPRDRNKILIYASEEGEHYGRAEMMDIETILEGAGYEVILEGRDLTEDITPLLTDDIGQFWFIGCEYSGEGTLTPGEVSAVHDYIGSCGNFFIMTEDHPDYTVDANLICNEYDIDFNGYLDHTRSSAAFECNTELLYEDHPVTDGIDGLTLGRNESKIRYSGVDDDFVPLIISYRGASTTIQDTIHAIREIGNSRLYFSSGFTPIRDVYIHGCGNETFFLNLASWLSESSYSEGDTVFHIATGPLDTRPPVPALDCPGAEVSGGDTVLISWVIDDMFPFFEEVELYVDYGYGSHTYTVEGTEFNLPIPMIFDTMHIEISVRDSFCNWGYDTCNFIVTSSGITNLTFTEDTLCDGQNIVEICYEYIGLEPADISCRIRQFGGISWTDFGYSWFRTFYETAGNIGADVSPGYHCFEWDLGLDYPWFESDAWEIEVYSGDMSDIATGPLDSRPPFVDIDCPSDTVTVDALTRIEWDIDDMFPSHHDQIVTVEVGGIADTLFITDFYEFHPEVGGHYSITVAVRDSFCNWGYDSCSFFATRHCAAEIERCFFFEERLCDSVNMVLLCYVLSTSCPDVPWPVEMSLVPGDGAEIPIVTIEDADGDTGMVYSGMHCFEWDMSADFPGFEGYVTFTVSITDSISADFTGILDSRPPRPLVEIDLQPARPLQTRDWYLVDYDDISPWPIEEGFWVLELCDSVDTFDIDWDTTTIEIPYIDCPDGRIIVALRDSFCNWTYDTLPIEVFNMPPSIFGCSNDTIDICIRDTLRRIMRISDEGDVLGITIDTEPTITAEWESDTLFFMPPDTGFYRIFVEAEDPLGITSACSLYFMVKECSHTDSFTYDLHRQWNMASSPLSGLIDIEAVFEGSIPPAYTFQTETGLNVEIEHAAPGVGFWVLAPSDATYTAYGAEGLCHSVSLTLIRGWNMIGPPAEKIPASILTDLDETIGDIFTYDADRSYSVVDTLRPGRGYWVIVADSVDITLE